MWPWSSYQEKVGEREHEWIDFNDCYLGLADTSKHRQRRYMENRSDTFFQFILHSLTFHLFNIFLLLALQS